MSGKTNAELATAYIAFRQGQGMEVFKEWRPVGGTHKEVLFIVPQGEGGNETTFAQLRARLAHWLNTEGIAKSKQQIKNIASVVGELADLRGDVPHDVIVQQAHAVKKKKPKKK